MLSCMAALCLSVQLDLQSRLTKVHSLSLSSESSEESFCTVRPDQVCIPVASLSLLSIHSVKSVKCFGRILLELAAWHTSRPVHTTRL